MDDQARRELDTIAIIGAILVALVVAWFVFFAEKPPTFAEKHNGKSRTEVSGEVLKKKFTEFRKGWNSK